MTVKIYHDLDGNGNALVNWSNLGGSRTVLTADTTYFVNPVTGADTNDGFTPGTAWESLEKAFSYIQEEVDAAGYTIILSLATGTYVPVGDSFHLPSVVGYDPDSCGGSPPTIDSPLQLIGDNEATTIVQGLELDHEFYVGLKDLTLQPVASGGTNRCLRVSRQGTVELHNITFSTPRTFTVGIEVRDGSQVSFRNAITVLDAGGGGDFFVFMLASEKGTIVSDKNGFGSITFNAGVTISRLADVFDGGEILLRSTGFTYDNTGQVDTVIIQNGTLTVPPAVASVITTINPFGTPNPAGGYFFGYLNNIPVNDTFVKTEGAAPTFTTEDGALRVDNVNDALYFRSGGAWVQAGGSGSGEDHFVENYTGANPTLLGVEALVIGADSNISNAAGNSINIGKNLTNVGEKTVLIGETASIGNASTHAIAIGDTASIGFASTRSIAIGRNAAVDNNITDSIQLGTGTNSTVNTLQYLTNTIANAQGLYTSFTAPTNYTPADNDNVTSHFQAIDTALGAAGGGETFVEIAGTGTSPTAAGFNAIAIGQGADSVNNGVAVGTDTLINGVNSGIAIGVRASTRTGGDNSISIGTDSEVVGTDDGIAIGNTAVVNGGAHNAVQIGTGTNSTTSTLQFLTNRLANAEGLYTSFTAPVNYTPADTDNVTSHFEAIDTELGTLSSNVEYVDINSTGTAPSAGGTDSISIGPASSTNGTSSIAIGDDANVAGSFSSIAIGLDSNIAATTDNSIAIGRLASINSGTAGVAIGHNAIVSAAGAIQLGAGTNSSANTLQYQGVSIADSSLGLVTGHSAVNYTAGNTSINTHLGGIDTELGSIQTDVTTLQNDTAENFWIDINSSTPLLEADATGLNSIVIGGSADAQQANAVVIGLSASSNGSSSVAIGDTADIAGAANAIAIGANTVIPALADNSIVIGPSSTVTGASSSASVVIGFGATTAEERCIAIGRDADAPGEASIALGDTALATGINAISIGRDSTAGSAGSFAIALGTESTANSGETIAIGYQSNCGVEGVALGTRAVTNGISKGVALGFEASVTANNSVQLGQGTNSNANTVQAFGAPIANSLSIEFKTQATGAAPSFAPTGGLRAGSGVFDTSNNTLWVYNGTAWVSTVLA